MSALLYTNISINFCKGCDNHNNCGFNCGYCKPGKRHFCKKCNNKNSFHRSNLCNGKMGNCNLNCQFCKPGQDHMCRNCGAINHHKTTKCPVKKIYNCMKCHSTIQASLPQRNPTTIKNGNSILFEIYIDSNNIKYVACHGDNVGRYNPKKYGLIMSAGGKIEYGSNALDTAIKESREEHGLINANNPRYLGSSSDDKNHYFISYTKPYHYDWNIIIQNPTRWEIVSDPKHVPNKCIGNKNCIQAGYKQSQNAIWFVPLETLLQNKNSGDYYTLFLQKIKKYHHLF
jgi:hypothetical protein